MRFLRTILLPFVLGVIASIAALNLNAVLAGHPRAWSLLTIMPLVEEASAVVALANLRSKLKTALTPVVVLLFGLGFSVLEFVSHVNLMERAQPPFPALVVWLGPLATMLFHTANASLAAWLLVGQKSLPAFLICAVLHAAYNAYILYGFINLPRSFEVIEVILRSAVLGLGIYLLLTLTAFDNERTRASAGILNSPT